MSVKKFTYEEIIQLRNSPYVLDVSPNQVHFSAEFKEKFWNGIQEGMILILCCGHVLIILLNPVCE